MKKHRIRLTNIPGDPVPVIWLELTEDNWIDVNINLDGNMEELHQEIHDKFDDKLFITFASRAFNLYPSLRGYIELGSIE